MPGPEGWLLSRVAGRIRGEIFSRVVDLRWSQGRPKGNPHGLPGPLVVSLTSHLRRFPTLHFSLKCLLSQSLAPDHVILWLREKDRSRLPENAGALQAAGLTIRTTSHTGSYGKIMPSIEAFPDAYVVTADDDVYYGRRWLEKLVGAVRQGERAVVCHRAHGIRLNGEGLPAPYLDWEREIPRPEVSRRVFPTGVGGVLYPPGILPRESIDQGAYRTLCPTADDVWLYWMALRNGAIFRKIGRRCPLVYWPRSQRSNLNQINVLHHGNDRQIANLVGRFGLPPSYCLQEVDEAGHRPTERAATRRQARLRELDKR
jgi:hypothetical protein